MENSLKFFCHACLEDKPISEQSLDSRYCESCFQFLTNEAKMLSGGKRPAWMPKAPQNTPEPSREPIQQARDCNKIDMGIS